jgi:hypothetical protein
VKAAIAIWAIRGSGANLSCGKFGRCDVSIDPDSDQADNMARQISGSVARRPPSLPILNCPLLDLFRRFDKKVAAAAELFGVDVKTLRRALGPC